MPLGRPVAALVVAVTSAPFVSWASTLDCAAYVTLKTAVETANDPVSAMITSPRESRRRWRDIDAATTPERPRAAGSTARRRTRLPEPSIPFDSRHANSAAPIHRRTGARNVT